MRGIGDKSVSGATGLHDKSAGLSSKSASGFLRRVRASGCRRFVSFLQIVNEKGPFWLGYLQKTHISYDSRRHVSHARRFPAARSPYGTIPGGTFPVRHHHRPHVPRTTGCLNPHRDIRKPSGTLRAYRTVSLGSQKNQLFSALHSHKAMQKLRRPI